MYQHQRAWGTPLLLSPELLRWYPLTVRQEEERTKSDARATRPEVQHSRKSRNSCGSIIACRMTALTLSFRSASASERPLSSLSSPEDRKTGQRGFVAWSKLTATGGLASQGGNARCAWYTNSPLERSPPRKPAIFRRQKPAP